MKILISWLAFQNDFNLDAEKKVRSNGPTCEFHRHFFDGYDKHILLSAGESPDPRLEYLVNALNNDFPDHYTVGEYLPIKDPINLREIMTRLETYLLQVEAESIDIFISPGTPAMQTAWYLLHMTLGLPTRLIQTRQRGIERPEKPERIIIDLEQNQFPASAVLFQKAQAATPRTTFLMTDSIQPVYERATQAAATDDVTVLIHGETGTGKEHLARFIHEKSIRGERGNFVAVNCSAMRDDLLESRLFGYRKGAFTGADSDRKGLFEEAGRGTIFLDEIGDISPYMQQVLLRVLQEKVVSRIGEAKERKIDVRVVAATHKDLLNMCEEGTFRWDLYYRLAIVELELPTLMERGPAEIRRMIQFLNEKEMKALRKPHLLRFSAEAREALLAHHWPGNIRELENVIRRLFVFADQEVQVQELPERIRERRSSSSLYWKDVEAAHIRKVFKLKKETNVRPGRRSATAPSIR